MTSFYNFFRFINSRHENISFNCETESNKKLTFLDILVTRKNKFTTNICRKPTFRSLYTNYKTGHVLTLLFRIYVVCSDWSKIQAEIIKLKTIMLKNNYPSSFTDRCIK